MTQHELWTAHRHQVRTTALLLWTRTTPAGRRCTDTDELIAAGEWALWQAAERYDPAASAVFWTYAQRRVWGAMVDWLRETAAGTRRHHVAVERFSEVAAKQRPTNRGRPGPGLQLEAAFAVYDVPSAALERHDEVDRQLRQLRERERVIMRLYHLDGLTMRQTAARVGLSESRVSQILTDALNQLREIAGLPPLPKGDRPSSLRGKCGVRVLVT